MAGGPSTVVAMLVVVLVGVVVLVIACMSVAAYPHHYITTISPVYDHRITTALQRYFLYLERF